MNTRRKSGFVYAIVAPDQARVKIGNSVTPKSRWRSFQTGSPVPLGVHSETFHDDVEEAESAAHAQLADARLHGEWFDMANPHVDIWLAEREKDTDWRLH
jgi:hypothetical protein